MAEKVKNKLENYDKYGSLGGIAGLYAGWLVIAVTDVTLSDRATCWYKTFRSLAQIYRGLLACQHRQEVKKSYDG